MPAIAVRCKAALLLFLALFAMATQAAVYRLPGSLPAGCSGASSTSYTCKNLSLDWNDSIVVVNANTTLTVTNTLTINGNEINTSSPVAGFSLVTRWISWSNYLHLNGNLSADDDIYSGSSTSISGTVTTTGVLSTGWATTIGGDVRAASITSGGGSTYGGSLAATAGAISLGSSDQVKGSLNATGNIVSGSSNTISGDVTSSAGYVVLSSANTSVGGSVSASGDVTLGSGTSVTGNVLSSGGGVTLRAADAAVGGDVTAWGTVLLESGTRVVGSVTSNNSNVQLNASGASVGKCITVDSSRSHWILLNWATSAGGVCCNNGGTCGTSCVDNSSGGAMPSVCTPSSACPNYGPTGASLDTSLWNVQAVSGSYTPAVVDVGGNKRFRLTSNGKNQSTMLQLKKWFPAAGNKIVVSFDYYVYGGIGADGMAVVFSDPSVALSPGAYGGSLGYAQKTGVNGFGGGWLAIGLDEYGGFSNAGEGRTGYPTGWTPPAGANSSATQRANAVSVRGSGSGTTGYALLASTGALSPQIWSSSSTSSSWQNFRITVDHSNSVNAYVTVERNTGSGYATVVPKFDAKGSKSGQAAVPQNWLLSFTGATGDYANYHEIANLSVCATYMNDPGGSVVAANFECLETGTLPTWSTSARKPLYTKLVNTGFKFDIVALKTDGSVESSYVAGSEQKNVTVELFDDSASPAPATCSAYASPLATQTLGFVASDAGRKTLADDFKLASSYRKLLCRVSDATNAASPVYGCSSDRFAVRPQAFAVTSPTANSDPSGSSASANNPAPTKAGTKFTLAAASSAPKYDAQPLIDSGKLVAHSGAVRNGELAGSFASADAQTGTATGAAFVYAEVGYFRFEAQGVYDDSYTSASGDVANGDCTDDFSNTAVGGKYGCKFGNTAATSYFGRFIPDHFVVTPLAVTPACNTFTYFGQDGFQTPFTLTAQNTANATTQNYSGAYVRLALSDWSNFVFTASPSLPSGSTLAASATAPSGTWLSGTATVSAKHQVGRPDALAGETAITVLAKPVDSDGVTSAAASAVQTASTPLRYGRLKLFNAYGTAKSDLKMPLQIHYWSGKSWVINVHDTCTAASLLPGAFAAYANGVSSAVSGAVVSSGTGTGWLTLSKPSPAASGFVDVAANLGASGSGNDQSCLAYAKKTSTPAGLPWLRSQNGNCAASYDRDPSARASFGIYSPEATKTVHVREAY